MGSEGRLQGERGRVVADHRGAIGIEHRTGRDLQRGPAVGIHQHAVLIIDAGVTRAVGVVVGGIGAIIRPGLKHRFRDLSPQARCTCLLRTGSELGQQTIEQVLLLRE